MQSWELDLVWLSQGLGWGLRGGQRRTETDGRRQKDRQRQTDEQTDRQTDRNRQTDRQTAKQTDRTLGLRYVPWRSLRAAGRGDDAGEQGAAAARPRCEIEAGYVFVACTAIASR